MAFLTEPVIDGMVLRFVMLCQRWGVKPVALVDGLWLWLSWTGLTWLAFVSSLLLVEVGERSDVSLLEGTLGGLLIGLAQWLGAKGPFAERLSMDGGDGDELGRVDPISYWRAGVDGAGDAESVLSRRVRNFVWRLCGRWIGRGSVAGDS